MNWPVIEENKSNTCVINHHELINVTSNDYLGMASHPVLKEYIAQNVMKYGVGSTGSRRLSGNHRVFLDTESYIANWIGKPAGCLFNSGYQMNSAIFSVLADTSTLIVADKWIHASLIDGIQHSAAKLVRFRHNDMDHLNQLLKKEAHQFKTVWIVCESIYSMDGDTASLSRLIQLKKQYHAKLIVDEAHSIGLYGKKGNGWINELGYIEDVDIVLLTFGKAFGLVGAMLLSTEEIVSKMKEKCRSYIYSTALPLPMVAGIQKSCQLIQESDDLRKISRQNITLFKKNIQTNSNTHIQPIMIGEKKEAIQVEQSLIKKGYFCRAVHHPTVPKGQSRLRMTITAQHTKGQIQALVTQINDELNNLRQKDE